MPQKLTQTVIIDAQKPLSMCCKKPAVGTPYTTCNRLLALPLGDYLTDYQYDHYVYLENPAILGINVEKNLKLNDKRDKRVIKPKF